ncbi:MAG: hypothetical protein IV100_18715 [Myxococcales bacterium]|nr:hypothetical protein [Myxococcales bacterium]
MTRRGLIVTFSGLDGCGKSTQMSLLAAALSEAGRGEARQLWSRGGYTEGVLAVKALARRVMGRKAPKAGPSAGRDAAFQRPLVRDLWLVVAILDLMRLYGVELRVRRAAGQVVLCDRYLWDTLADFEVNFPGADVASWPLWKLLVAVTPTPDGAFFLDLDVATAEARALAKNDPFPEPTSQRQKRRAAYERLIVAGRFRVLDALLPREAIARRIWESLGLHSPEATETLPA